MDSSEAGGQNVIDVFPSTTEPFGQRPEPLQKDPVTWKETLRPALESYIQIQVKDGRVFAIQAPQLEARRSEDHLKRCVDSAQIQRTIGKSVSWRKVVTTLRREPTSATKNASVRHFYKAEGHMFLVKFGFTFGLRQVAKGTQHVYQMSQVPMLCFHLPPRNKPCADLTRRMFKDTDQIYYVSHVFRPHKNYVVPADTYYLILALQKTIFSVQVIPDRIQLSSTHYLPFTSHKERETLYNIPPQTPRPHDESVTHTGGASKKHDWNQYVIPKIVQSNVSPICEPPSDIHHTIQQYVDSAEVTNMLWEYSLPDVTQIGVDNASISPATVQNDMLFVPSQNNQEMTFLAELQNFTINSIPTMELEMPPPQSQNFTSVQTMGLEMAPPQSQNFTSAQTMGLEMAPPQSQNFTINSAQTMGLEVPPPQPPLTTPEFMNAPTLVSSPAQTSVACPPTRKPTLPFKTDFVTTPWNRNPQPLVKPPLMSRRLEAGAKPSNAHAPQTSHGPYLAHVLRGVYEIPVSAETSTTPVNLTM